MKFTSCISDRKLASRPEGHLIYQPVVFFVSYLDQAQSSKIVFQIVT